MDIRDNEKARHLVRELALHHRFVFLGHSLDEREAHIRRDLNWIEKTASQPRNPHLLVTSTSDPRSAKAHLFVAELGSNTPVQVVQFIEANHSHQATELVATILGGQDDGTTGRSIRGRRTRSPPTTPSITCR